MQIEKLAMATTKGKFAITLLIINMNTFRDAVWKTLQ